MQFELVGFFEVLSNAHAHEMIRDLDRDGPLRIVNIRKMSILLH